MPENTKEKKLKIYKFASEYNLATETLVDFLNEKGYKVKSHMSALTDEMLADIQIKFKKDIEKAEKHYKKISEFNKKRSDKTDTAEDAAVETEAVETVGEQQKAEVHEEEKQETTEEIKSETGEETSAETSEDIISEEIKEETKVEEEGSYQTQTEKDLKNKKTGLRVVGKMDLGADKRKPIQEKPEVKKDAPAGTVKPAATTAAEDEEAKKKKKKKKLKAKKKAEVGPEEIIKAKKKRKAKKQEVDKKEVEAAIKRTLMSMDESGVGDRASARKKKEEKNKKYKTGLMKKN